MAYTPIAKLNKFNDEENDAQVWLNNIAKAITANNWDNARVMQAIPYFLQDTADTWYQSLTVKPQNFNEFKTEFLQYFSNNNSINKLTNTFTMIRQGDTEAVTIYLRHFHRNLHQIQAIQADYFTVPQILNQFIRRLCSSILQQVRSMHPVDFLTAVTYARDFEAAKLEVNHTQAVNLAMNGLSELDSKLKQFKTQSLVLDSKLSPESRPIPTHLLAYDASTNLSTTSLSNFSLLTATTSNLSDTATRSCQGNSGTGLTQNPNSQHYLSLLVTSEDATSSNQGIEQQQQPPTNNISSATIIENKSLDAIFLFKLGEPLDMPLFSKAILEKKLITAMYTDAKIDGHSIKLIFDSHQVDRTASARIITVDGATKTPIGEINDFPIEVNGIIVPIKVLIMETTQYQALVGNDWLFKTNAMLDWMTQELILSQNGQHMRVPAMCDYFKAINTTAPLIDLKEKKPKSTWEVYQILWANEEHNKLPPILSCDDNGKGKQKRIKPT
ncbi:hypothetical protein G9A89_019720 [Geosiphon pyriformis]|nr:hypothetical protein G9A89_019720 [Geosiphon pyriformis]